MQSHFCTLCNSSWFYSLLFFWFIVKMLNGRVAFKEHFIKCRNISTLVSIWNSCKKLFSVSNKKISEISSLDFWARRPIKSSWLGFFLGKGRQPKWNTLNRNVRNPEETKPQGRRSLLRWAHCCAHRIADGSDATVHNMKAGHSLNWKSSVKIIKFTEYAYEHGRKVLGSMICDYNMYRN